MKSKNNHSRWQTKTHENGSDVTSSNASVVNRVDKTVSDTHASPKLTYLPEYDYCEGCGKDGIFTKLLPTYCEECFNKRIEKSVVKEAIEKLMLNCPIQRNGVCYCKPLEDLKKELGISDEETKE